MVSNNRERIPILKCVVQIGQKVFIYQTRLHCYHLKVVLGGVWTQ